MGRVEEQPVVLTVAHDRTEERLSWAQEQIALVAGAERHAPTNSRPGLG